MNDLIGEYLIDPDLCHALMVLFESNTHKTPTALERGYTLVSSNNMPVNWMYRYETEIYRCVIQYTEEFKYSSEGCTGINMEHPYNVQYYPPGKHYSVWHCENNGIKPYDRRHLAFMTYLNTVGTGGETEFLYQQRKFSPVCGKTLVWPAYFTHTHRGVPAATDKFIITGWFRYFDTEKFNQETEDLCDKDFYVALERLNSVK